MVYELAGEGSVFRTTNNGVSVYRAKISVKDSTSGESLTITGTGSTRKQAVERRDRNLQRRLTQIDATTTPDELPRAKTRLRARRQGLTLSQYETVWHSVTGSRTKPQTKAKHSQRLAQWIYPWLDHPMSSLTRTQIEVHLRTTLPAQGAGETSIYDSYCSLKALLSSAVAHDYLKTNPAANVHLSKPTPKVKHDDARLISKRLKIFQYLTKELADPHHENHAYYPVVLLMGIGMRRAEILGLEWKNLHLPKRGTMTLVIEQQLIRGEDGYRVQPSTKTNKPRTLRLEPKYRRAFLEHRERTSGEGLVFQKDSQHWTYSYYNREWRRVLTQYLTKDGRELREDDLWRPHVNRKIAATLLAQSGVSVKVAAEILGHDPTVLLRTYHDPTRDDLANGLAALTDKLTED